MRTETWHEVVLTEEANRAPCRHLLQHYAKGQVQEDLCFGLWTPSRGLNRETAIVTEILLPGKGERELHVQHLLGQALADLVLALAAVFEQRRQTLLARQGQQPSLMEQQAHGGRDRPAGGLDHVRHPKIEPARALAARRRDQA